MSNGLRHVTTLEPEVAELLALAMYPDSVRVRAALEKYASDPQRQVWVWQARGKPVCAIGLRINGNAAEILHIGTQLDARRQGHARQLLFALLERLDLTTLEAETDDGAAGFYRRAGFKVEETEGRGGHVRYRCTLLT
ncbi:GNAT family N-acetyltransferase [Deinococcus radiomollis]|uniref:GNAT family N-acetyltransferase n=1 Tax=Deinococcus radiomollis TaxID=468916 RepID=UPI0038921B8C